MFGGTAAARRGVEGAVSPEELLPAVLVTQPNSCPCPPRFEVPAKALAVFCANRLCTSVEACANVADAGDAAGTSFVGGKSAPTYMGRDDPPLTSPKPPPGGDALCVGDVFPVGDDAPLPAALALWCAVALSPEIPYPASENVGLSVCWFCCRTTSLAGFTNVEGSRGDTGVCVFARLNVLGGAAPPCADGCGCRCVLCIWLCCPIGCICTPCPWFRASYPPCVGLPPYPPW